MKGRLNYKLKYVLLCTAAVFTTLLCLNLNTFSANAAPILKLNSHGHDVVMLQKSLLSQHYDISAVSGTYDKQTQDAVKAFQKKNKLKVTGIVDRETWWAIRGGKPNISAGSAASSKNTGSSEIWNNTSSVPYGQTFLMRSEVKKIVSTAKSYMGIPYVFGGDTPEEGFDCSGYLEYVFAQNGIGIPRTADEQYKLGKAVKTSQLTEGDLVFFTTYEPGASHCGLYLGDDNFIHASSSGVRIDNLSNSYWSSAYLGGKHIVK